MIFSAALLHSSPWNKTDENIRNCSCRVVKGMMLRIRFLVGRLSQVVGYRDYNVSS
jgi:hypothetical protein